MPTSLHNHTSNRVLIVDDDPGFRALMMNAVMSGSTDSSESDASISVVCACENDSQIVTRAAQRKEPFSVAFVNVGSSRQRDAASLNCGLERIEELWKRDTDLQIVACLKQPESKEGTLRSAASRPDQLVVLTPSREARSLQKLVLSLCDKRRVQIQNRDLLFDISTRLQEAQESLRLKNRHLELASRMARVGYGSMDLATQRIELSENGCRILQIEKAETHSILELMSILSLTDRIKFQLLLDESIYRASDFEYKFCFEDSDGQDRYVLIQVTCERDANKAKTSLFLVVRDVTDEENVLQAVQHASLHDSLTGLPNRAMFNESLEAAIKIARRHNVGANLILLDLDRFKEVNDSLGHPVGDGLLKEFSNRLKSCVGESDLVARLGGDEFAIVQRSFETTVDALELIEKLYDSMLEPVQVAGKSIFATFSAGVAVAPTNGNDVDAILRNADLALYRAKQEGRGISRFFDSEMDQQLRERLLIEADLMHALERDQFELHYQPIICTTSEKTSGMEALVRWYHPTRGLVRPDIFIEIAESTSVIVPIGAWILERACRDATLWPDDVSVAVNVSAVQLQHGSFSETVRATLAKTGLPPHRLEMEITETAFLGNCSETLRTLEAIRELGVRIAMDDFGTGYSSLSYLQNFPFDKIKLDRSFVFSSEQPESRAIISAVAGIGESLGLKTCAEGVETREQFDIARLEGYTHVQGYFFGKPEPLDSALKLFAELESHLDSR